MKIHLVEPFLEGSYQNWAEAYQKYSQHQVEILSLPGRHWKWRMYGGAVALARQFMEMDFQADCILATDMLDLTTFLALTRSKNQGIPCALYFHENQITYPWSPTDQDVALRRHNQYGFINYTSALVADRIFFNSHYHLTSFTHALPSFLEQFPDFKELDNVEKIQQKSEVLPLGMDLSQLLQHQSKKNMEEPIVLWNHRWEYDKNPSLFFKTLFKIAEEGASFKLIVLGAGYRKVPEIFSEAKERLRDKIIHWGFVSSFSEYAQYLWQANIYPVSSQQDFFGGSVVQALYCGNYPILPQRLAYPEHIPAALHKTHFYQTDEDFYVQLKQLIQNFSDAAPLLVDNATIQNFVSRYDWSTLAPRYDKAFSNITNPSN